MLNLLVTFLVIALVAVLFGFGGIAAQAAYIPLANEDANF